MNAALNAGLKVRRKFFARLRPGRHEFGKWDLIPELGEVGKLVGVRGLGESMQPWRVLVRRRKASVLAAARLLGQRSFIYEVGCALVIDGEEEFLTDGLIPRDGRTIFELIEDSGAPMPVHVTASSICQNTPAAPSGRSRVRITNSNARCPDCGCVRLPGPRNGTSPDSPPSMRHHAWPSEG